MTSPTLMYSTPTAQQFNKKAQQKSGNRGASYTTGIKKNGIKFNGINSFARKTKVSFYIT